MYAEVRIKGLFRRFVLYDGAFLRFALRHCARYHPQVDADRQLPAQCKGIGDARTLKERVGVVAGHSLYLFFGLDDIAHTAVWCCTYKGIPARQDTEAHADAVGVAGEVGAVFAQKGVAGI